MVRRHAGAEHVTAKRSEGGPADLCGPVPSATRQRKPTSEIMGEDRQECSLEATSGETNVALGEQTARHIP